jgi:thiol-disulfide isomerase/thioredoxin
MQTRTLMMILAMLVLGACARDEGSEGAAGADHGPAAAEVADAGPDDPPRLALELELLDGGHFELAALRGEWVVVNFWATWCAPCLKEIPDLSQLHDSRGDLTVIGLAYEDIGADAMRAFLERVPASYPIAIIDPYADSPAGDFDTPRGLPMTYLIAPDGSIARRFLGPVTSDEINEAITAHAPG